MIELARAVQYPLFLVIIKPIAGMVIRRVVSVLWPKR